MPLPPEHEANINSHTHTHIHWYTNSSMLFRWLFSAFFCTTRTTHAPVPFYHTFDACDRAPARSSSLIVVFAIAFFFFALIACCFLSSRTKSRCTDLSWAAGLVAYISEIRDVCRGWARDRVGKGTCQMIIWYIYVYAVHARAR